MYLQQFFVDGLGHASYLIGSDSTHEAAVVDPRRDVAVYLEAAAQAGLRIRYALETHVHNDFLSGARAIASALGAEHVASAEAGLTFPHHGVRDGATLTLGELVITVLATPGHTPEHVSYVVADTARTHEPVLIFTGGDLLVGSVGRPDLLGREMGEKLAPRLYDSLFGKILKLEDYVEVLPTHGAGSLCGRAISSKRTTTIGYERRFNVFLQKKDRREFVDFVLDGNPFIPAYYRNMRPANIAGPDAFTAPPPRPLTVAEVEHALGHGALVVDTRSPAAFGAAHLPGAYNVGLGPMLPTWVGSLVPSDVPIVLVLDRESDWHEAVTALGRIGYEKMPGYLADGISAWQTVGLPTERIEQIDVRELARRHAETPDLQIVDVRMPSEWESGSIAGSTLVSLTDLHAGLDSLDRGRPTAVICSTGYRSGIAASILAQNGIRSLANVTGGMTAWDAAGLETVSLSDTIDSTDTASPSGTIDSADTASPTDAARSTSGIRPAATAGTATS
ncbi:MAG: MBL fold metallo-hydrolase [Chloroflexi bacterium]|nr:MBL fold metallo-hydrolase [Chloroflexota bacterium]